MATAPLAFADHDFLVNYDDLIMGPQVGSGHFSNVYIGRYFGESIEISNQWA